MPMIISPSNSNTPFKIRQNCNSLVNLLNNYLAGVCLDCYKRVNLLARNVYRLPGGCKNYYLIWCILCVGSHLVTYGDSIKYNL
jgi:hypothetical protein